MVPRKFADGPAATAAELYRVLGGILALGEFSRAELARFADVTTAVARRVLDAEGARYVTGRGDGTDPRYRLKSGRRPALVGRLRALEDAERVSYSTEDVAADGIPAALAVATQMLLEQLPRITDALERQHTIALARLALDDARHTPRSAVIGGSARADAHEQVVDSALLLAQSELNAVLTGSAVRRESLEPLRASFTRALHAAARAGDEWLAERLSIRYLSSPFAQFLGRLPELGEVRVELRTRPVLLFEPGRDLLPHGQLADLDRVREFIRSALSASRVAFQPVALTEEGAELALEQEPEPSAPYLTPDSPVCVLPVLSGWAGSERMLRAFSAACGDQPDRLIVSEGFDPGLNSLTHEAYARYVSMAGLGAPGLLGAMFHGWRAGGAGGTAGMGGAAGVGHAGAGGPAGTGGAPGTGGPAGVPLGGLRRKPPSGAYPRLGGGGPSTRRPGGVLGGVSGPGVPAHPAAAASGPGIPAHPAGGGIASPRPLPGTVSAFGGQQTPAVSGTAGMTVGGTAGMAIGTAAGSLIGRAVGSMVGGVAGAAFGVTTGSGASPTGTAAGHPGVKGTPKYGDPSASTGLRTSGQNPAATRPAANPSQT
ncbi:hypothetical protein AB0M28_13860 [Streptomyces sp. NPDC051940]|uniref:hypothetical protein n=1 Tax=Streptomyces sp. NPDC051940 TaxID=3155675 RepID=UPI003413343C